MDNDRPIRVALDASFLEMAPSGIGSYVQCLAATLREIGPAHGVNLHLVNPHWPDDHVIRSRRARWELHDVGAAARALQPDLLHIPNFSAPFRAGVPFVATIHDVIPLVLPAYRTSPAMKAHLNLVTRNVRSARLVLTPSQAAAADIERVLGIPSSRVRVTPLGAPSVTRHPSAGDIAEVHQRLGIDGPYIFNVGGLDVRKNLPALIEALALVAPHIPDLRLVIAGTPHSENPAVFPPLQPVIDRHGLGKRVILTGRISDDDRSALYSGAAIYCTPSRYEGFGLTALEAMAHGVPVISSNATSLPEVVGDAGLLVDPDPANVAVAITRLVTDHALADRLRAAGLARAAGFTWERTALLTIAAYREALA